MDLSNLTQEQKDQLKKQLAAEEKAEKQKRDQDRETLKVLQDEFVTKFFPKLVEVAKTLTLAKAELFENAATILALKKSVYGLTDEAMEKQQSHSISTLDFEKTIILGSNTVDGWDMDLATAGIDGVNNWLTSKLNDDNKELVEMIRDLLKPNKDGVLKANRVLELSTRAAKIGDQTLIGEVDKIREAYRPEKTTTFIKAKMKSDIGKDIWLNLSMSNA